MKIAEVHIYQHELPVRNGPFVMAKALVDSLDTTIVKIVADNGLVGWGENLAPLALPTRPVTRAAPGAALCQIAPGLLGASALTPLAIRRTMDEQLNGHRYAKAAIEYRGV